MDVTFVVWVRGGDKLKDFLDHLNSTYSRYSNTRFIGEEERGGKIGFLDVLVEGTAMGQLAHGVHEVDIHRQAP